MAEHMRDILPWREARMIELEWTDDDVSLTRRVLLRVDHIVFVHHLEEDRKMHIVMSDGTRWCVPECYAHLRSVIADVCDRS
jgi:hypothetical protein